MKYILSIIIIASFISCNQDAAELTTINEVLTVNALKEYLPAAYFNESNIVFKNEMGDEWKLSTNAKESISDRMHNQKPYKAEKFEITLFDPDNTYFQIILTGNTNYATSGNLVLSLGGMLMPFNSSGTTWSTIRFLNNQPIVSLGDDFRDLYSVHGNEFKNTYLTIGKDGNIQHSAYSELNMNSEQGVVAFRDENNELWVFERIEE